MLEGGSRVRRRVGPVELNSWPNMEASMFAAELSSSVVGLLPLPRGSPFHLRSQVAHKIP